MRCELVFIFPFINGEGGDKIFPLSRKRVVSNYFSSEKIFIFATALLCIAKEQTVL